MEQQSKYSVMMSTEKISVDGSHRKSKNNAGQIFNWLTSIRPTGEYRGRCEVWEFSCKCGELTTAVYSRVRNGYTKSCGCRRIDSAVDRAPLKLIGRRFGRLLVTSREGSSKHRSALWLCLCDCGNTVTVPSISLTKGATKSCGCRKLEIFARTRKQNKLSDVEKVESLKRRRVLASKAARLRRMDGVYRASQSLSSCLRFALKRLNEGKTASTFRMLSYTPRALREHLARQFDRGMSWSNYGDWQIDHIVPVCEARTIEDVIRLNALSNLRPLWRLENMQKNGRRTFLC